VADLSPITAKVVASASGMAGGLADAEKRLKESTGKMAAQAKADGDKAGSGFMSTFKTGLSFAFGTALFGGLTAAFSKVTGLLTDGAARMQEVGTAARKAGADVAGFQVIVEALNNDIGTATEAIIKLKENIGKALVEGTDDLVKPFERLKLDPVELLGMRDDKALALVAARLQELGGGVAEARAGVALFGDKFKDVRVILDDGGEWLRKTADDLKKFGAAFGEGDFLQSREWARALNQLSLLWKGLQVQIAQGLMPVLNEAMSRLGSLADWGITAAGLKNVVLNTIEGIGKAGIYLVGVFSDHKTITGAWDVVFAHIKAGILDTIVFVVDKLAAAFDGSSIGRWINESLVPAMETLQDDADDLRRAAADAAAGLANTVAAAVNPRLDWWSEFMRAARARSDGLFTPIRDKGLEIFRLWEQASEKMAKALEGPVDKFREAVQQVVSLGRLDRLAQGQSVLNSIPGADLLSTLLGPAVAKLPQGVVGGAMNLLGKLGGDLIDMTDIQARTLGKAFGDLQSAFGNTYQPVAAARQGSAEAFSAIQANKYGRESVEEAIRRILEQQLEQERVQANTGREVAKAVKALNAKLNVRGIN